MTTRLLEEGDVIELTAVHRVYATIPKHFLYAKRRGDFTFGRDEVSLAGESMAWMRGRYVVVKTAEDGGGLAHDGPFPSGHHVWCESIDDRSRKVDFYQTGCFTCMIPDILPVGRATLKWVVEP